MIEIMQTYFSSMTSFDVIIFFTHAFYLTLIIVMEAVYHAKFAKLVLGNTNVESQNVSSNVSNVSFHDISSVVERTICSN